MNDVTKILNQIESGDTAASEQLLPLIYDELRKLAAVRLANEKAISINRDMPMSWLYSQTRK